MPSGSTAVPGDRSGAGFPEGSPGLPTAQAEVNAQQEVQLNTLLSFLARLSPVKVDWPPTLPRLGSPRVGPSRDDSANDGMTFPIHAKVCGLIYPRREAT